MTKRFSNDAWTRNLYRLSDLLKVESRVTCEDICCLEIVFVLFAYLLCYKREMEKSQRGKRGIDIVENRGELNAAADNSAVSERIVALKKSKAGHLGENRDLS